MAEEYVIRCIRCGGEDEVGKLKAELEAFKKSPTIESGAAWYKYSQKLRELLEKKKTGDCWCQCGIDNPMMGGKHSDLCIEIKETLEG